MYSMLHYIYHSSYNHTQPKQIIQEQTDIQSQNCLAQHLAQAEGSRSGEFPTPPRRGHKNTRMDNAGSRLGETPLAWASCLLAQKSSWSPRRPFAQKLWASSLFISPRRDWLAWARLTGLASVSPAAAKFFTQTVHATYSHASKRNITP